MLDVYLAPGRAFARLKEKPTWLIPLVVVLVFNMLFVFVSRHYVDWDKQPRATVEHVRERNVPQEQIDKTKARLEKIYSSPAMRYGVPEVGVLFASFYVLLFLAVVYNVSLPLFGASSDFWRTWAVVCNAGLVAVPATMVRGGLVMLKRSSEVTTSLLMAAPGLKQPFLKTLLSRLDVFDLWKFVLIAIGLKVVFGVKSSKSCTLVFAVWLITLVLSLVGKQSGGR